MKVDPRASTDNSKKKMKTTQKADDDALTAKHSDI